MNHVSIILSNQIEELKRLEAFMGKLSSDWEIDDRASYQMQLALDELVTNTILYGFAELGSADSLIQIDVVRMDEGWELRITDSGIPFNPLLRDAPDLELGIEQRGIGGLGIHFVRQVMDQIVYERVESRNVLTMKKLRQLPN
ncbi:ATP-binding protein [Paenibacillus hexagrammi]|uniref:ATP-binding protein n=1 Tax=Paenibacillus hexagrammi TaxID=2908839 RepID=A0ABY3SLV6_9BACL|nr:ATP-binding protein [Paenibacillus sp. YPD9-1]UJF34105.1 ATP-binding protein [Paenibacillus sp. YPD9-1]